MRHKERKKQKVSTKRETNTYHTLVKKNFYTKLSSLSTKMFFGDGSTLIIYQQESEKTIWKADFELKILQRFRF